jgi:hypothetical protein
MNLFGPNESQGVRVFPVPLIQLRVLRLVSLIAQTPNSRANTVQVASRGHFGAIRFFGEELEVVSDPIPEAGGIKFT